MKPCHKCKVGTILVDLVIQAKPYGSYQISKESGKFLAKERYKVTCSNCDLCVLGRLEGAAYDSNGVFTAGHFVEERE